MLKVGLMLKSVGSENTKTFHLSNIRVSHRRSIRVVQTNLAAHQVLISKPLKMLPTLPPKVTLCESFQKCLIFAL